jgi:hypothetical protein
MKALLKKLAIYLHFTLSDEERQMEQEWLEYVNELQNQMR